MLVAAEANNLRIEVRKRDEQHRDLNEKISLHNLEVDKWQDQTEQLSMQIANLENQLSNPLMRIFEPILGEKASSLCAYNPRAGAG